MQVPDHALQAHDLLAVKPQNDAEHAMGRGMLRPHIDDELVGIQKSLIRRFQIQRRECVRIAHYFACFLVRCYWPLSIPKLICTHSLSCCRIP